ncbi:DUF6011 domain-containing protein [Mycobacteroides salmoniphilum]
MPALFCVVRCQRCRRPLHTPLSVASLCGPVCSRHLRGSRAVAA